ncbi:MAG: hypothetical protein QG622_3221, partial [Actinomycetota bacterium]|nr:hypothetical protein [Actinomycetota bacterium]
MWHRGVEAGSGGVLARGAPVTLPDDVAIRICTSSTNS